jgi:hypothetical protein
VATGASLPQLAAVPECLAPLLGADLLPLRQVKPKRAFGRCGASENSETENRIVRAVDIWRRPKISGALVGK